LPPLTLFLLVAMLAVYIGMRLAPTAVERWIVFHFAFIPAAWLIEEWPIWSMAIAPFTYSFLHSDLLHLSLNSVMLAVMGQVLEPRLGRPRFFLVFAVGVVGGALAHALLGGSAHVPLVGASAGVGALYGAGLVLHRRHVSLGPNTQALLALTAFFVITNLLGLILPVLSHIAYAAHLGGFVTGMLMMSRLCRPGSPKGGPWA
jgi:membrane associated rhomboid family serine protease